MNLPIEIARSIQYACLAEATARKAGNVHRGADFSDLYYTDFLLSAAAIAPVFIHAAEQPLGWLVLEAIRATRTVVSTNTNLGIVLLLAPLAKAAAMPGPNWHAHVTTVLNASSIDDTKNVYEAIRHAQPGGLGEVPEQDITQEPSESLVRVMALAEDRDQIARQYIRGFSDIFHFGLPALHEGFQRYGCIEGAIVAAQLAWLAAYPDSLIARKHGSAIAEECRQQAERVQALGLGSDAGLCAYMELDRAWRNARPRRNPGTTADLVTACLFVALRDHTMNMKAPFRWARLDALGPAFGPLGNE